MENQIRVSGLINAYKTATQIAIENATIVEKSIKDKYEITFNYDLMNEVMRIIKKNIVLFTIWILTIISTLSHLMLIVQNEMKPLI